MMLIKKMLELKPIPMSTNQVVEAVGISKQGFVQMMTRMHVQPCDVQKTRGQYGLYIWDMKEIKRLLRADNKINALKKEV
jgi:hypothetical protein